MLKRLYRKLFRRCLDCGAPRSPYYMAWGLQVCDACMGRGLPPIGIDLRKYPEIRSLVSATPTESDHV